MSDSGCPPEGHHSVLWYRISGGDGRRVVNSRSLCLARLVSVPGICNNPSERLFRRGLREARERSGLAFRREWSDGLLPCVMSGLP